MTGDVLPITKKVLKFTEIDIKQDRTINACHEKIKKKNKKKNKKTLSHVLCEINNLQAEEFKSSPALEECI